MSFHKYNGTLQYGNKDLHFNEENFKMYLAEENYEDAANYALQFMPDDIGKRNTYIRSIDSLRKKGQMLKEYTSNVIDEDKKAAIRFKYALDNNINLPEKLPERYNYTKQYRDLVKRYGSSNDHDASAIRFTIDNAENNPWYSFLNTNEEDGSTIDVIARNLGINESDAKNRNALLRSRYGVQVEEIEGGKTRITLNKNNSNFLDILKGIHNSNVREENIVAQGVYQDKDGIKEIDSKDLYVRTVGYDPIPSGRVKTFGSHIVDFINRIDAKATIPNTEDYDFNKQRNIVYSKDYASFGHALLFQRALEMGMDISDYKAAKSMLDDQLKEALRGPLDEYRIYATVGRDNVMESIDDDTRIPLNGLLQEALAENSGKRVSTHAGTIGDKHGLFVTISPENKETETPINKVINTAFDTVRDLFGHDKARDFSTQEVSFFIEDFEHGDQIDALYSDPDVRAQMELQDLRDFKHTKALKTTDSNGNIVDSSIKPVYKDGVESYNQTIRSADGAYTKVNTQLYADKAQKALRQNFQIERMINMISNASTYDINIDDNVLSKTNLFFLKPVIDEYISEYYGTVTPGTYQYRVIANNLLNQAIRNSGVKLIE